MPQDNEGRTAMHIACFQGYSECVQLLIDLKASLEMTDKDSNTPLSLAALKYEIFVNFPWLFRGNKKCMSILLKVGANPNVQNASGLSPLHYAGIQLEINIS